MTTRLNGRRTVVFSGKLVISGAIVTPAEGLEFPSIAESLEYSELALIKLKSSHLAYRQFLVSQIGLLKLNIWI
jgi:hypothetical protein